MKRLLAGAMALSLLCGPAAMVAAPLEASAQTINRTVVQHPNGTRTVRRTVVRPNGNVRTTVRQKWGRGQRLPAAYRTAYVTDYNRYHLRRPPSGYRWVRRDNQYLLIAATTGLIASVIAASQ